MAAQENEIAQYNFGVMYDSGYGTAKNAVLAKKCYLKAENIGKDQAKQALSEIQ